MKMLSLTQTMLSPMFTYTYKQYFKGGLSPPFFVLLLWGCHQTTHTHTTAQAERSKMLNLNDRERKEKVIEQFFNKRFQKLPEIQDWSDKELDEWLSYVHLMLQGGKDETS